MLAEQIEPATGLLGTIVKLAPRTPADSLKVLVEIAQTSTSGMVALQNMANEADLDSILAAEAAGISSAGLPEDDAAGKSSTGGSTGGMQPKSTPTKAPDSPWMRSWRRMSHCRTQRPNLMLPLRLQLK